MNEATLRIILTFMLKLCFGVRIRGIEHFKAAGDRVLIIANHQSFLDPLLLAVFMPEKPAFAMNVFQAKKWYFRWCRKVVKVYELDATQPMSMKALLTDLKKGAKVVLFPEGRITTSGGIMKIYDGAAMIANKTGASLLPIHLDGGQFSKLSKLAGKFPQTWFPRVSLQFFAAITPTSEQPITSRDIYDVMTYNTFAAQNSEQSLLSALVSARKLYGNKKVIASDISRVEMNYKNLFIRSFIVSSKLKRYVKDQRYVAMLLPNSLAAMVTFVSLHMLGKVPAMLNFSAGQHNILQACQIAKAKTIITSRTFVEKGGLESLIAALEKEHVIIFLEDLRATVGLFDKLSALFKARIPSLFMPNLKASEPAVVLYTSGSEGAPKGVALSHINIITNINQSCARLDLTPADRLFNALPVFHSFGLTIGTLLPMLRGIFVFFYPSPLHYRTIPELAYDTDATILVGTDTFYLGYAQYANPYDFHKIRFAVAGAEKLKTSTRELYAERFGVSILQGYGVTETSPVLSCNTFLYQKTGTVGRFFPAIEWKLEAVEGITQGGRLWVKGANVMLGYMKIDAPGVIQPHGEWYDTGDIVDVDAEGFIRILGRAKRFAKIAGEMVSLAAVEEFIAQHSPDAAHAAVAIPDARKGEQIVLFTESTVLNRSQLIDAARASGIAEIMLPKQIHVISEIPRLGSGKVDYPTLSKHELLKS